MILGGCCTASRWVFEKEKGVKGVLIIAFWVFTAGAALSQSPATQAATLELYGIPAARIETDSDLILHSLAAHYYRLFGSDAVLIVRRNEKNNSTDRHVRPPYMVPSLKRLACDPE